MTRKRHNNEKLMAKGVLQITAASHRRKMVRKHILSVAGKIMNEEKYEGYMTEIMDHADIVFGVWADPQHPDGCTTMLIKGRLLANEIPDNEYLERSIDALPCASLKHAQQIAQSLGEPVAADWDRMNDEELRNTPVNEEDVRLQ